MLEGINWIGVGAAVIAAFLFGYLWYGPIFGKAWMRELGKTQEQLQQAGGQMPALAIQLVATIVTATVLAIFVKALGVGLANGLVVGVLAAAGFVATSKLGDVIFAQRSSSTYYWIDAGHSLISYALMGAIYGALG